MSDTLINRVKKALVAAVGSDRLERVGDADQLVQSGIISSLEIVMIGLELEREFLVSVPDKELTVANFDSLNALAMLMGRLIGSSDAVENGKSEPETGIYKRLLDSLTGCYRHPFILALFIAFWFALLDIFALPYFLERGPLAATYAQFSDYGKRLYHSSGGWAPNDLQVAVRRHRIVQDRNPGSPSILFFGDSGTVGSWVRAEDAPPARVEERLRAAYPSARVHNFGFFMRSFIKDVMLLEALLEENEGRLPADAVVFTLSDAYFDAAFQKSLIDAMPYFSLNRNLLKRFRDRRNTGQNAAAYNHLLDYLALSNRKHRSRFEECFLEHTSIYRYKPFLSFLTHYGKAPQAYWEKEYATGNKPLFPTRLLNPPADFKLHDAGFDANSLDRDIVVLLGDTLDFLNQRGIKVYFFIRPYAPLEWKNHQFPTRGMDVVSLIRAEGWDKKATVIDLRWSLYGDQFSDSLSHYTPAGSKVLGNEIGVQIVDSLNKPLAMEHGRSISEKR